MRTKPISAAIAAFVLGGCGGGASENSIEIPAAPAVLSVATYGAKGDGATDDTAAIQKALDAASTAQGTLSFPKGTYMTGALYIKSNTTLKIDEGVTLKAIQAQTWWDINTTTASGAADGLNANGKALYPQVFTRVQGTDMNWTSAIINIRYAENVKIIGKGTIDGNGQSWWSHYYGEGTTAHSTLGATWALNWDEQRPRGIETFEAKNITIEGVTVQNSPFWTIHLCYTDKVHIDGVKVFNMPTAATGRMPSTDGIDIDSSTNVLVENADITANDDAFAIKSGRDGDGLRVNRPTANVVIRNSTVRAGSAAFTIGSETSGGAKNIEVYNIKVKPAVALIDSNIGYKTGGPAVFSGFIFKSAPTRGGVMEDVYIHDIEIDNAYFFMRAEQNWPSSGKIPAAFGSTHLKPAYWDPILLVPTPVELGYPVFKRFRFENITMKNVERQVFSIAGATLTGETEKGRYVDFSFKNIKVNAVGSAGDSKSAGSIKHATNWAFTNSSIVNAAGVAIAPTLEAATTSNVLGLPGW